MTDLVPRLDGVRPLTLAVGAGVILALLTLQRYVPRAPGPLLVITAAALVVSLPGLAGEVAVLGHVPGGLPSPALPTLALSDMTALLPSAGAIAFVSYLESISTATVFARRTRSRVDPNGELIGLGAANLASACPGPDGDGPARQRRGRPHHRGVAAADLRLSR